MQNLYCPHCGRKISATGVRTGQIVSCPFCGKSFTNTLRDDQTVVAAKPAPQKAQETIAGIPKGQFYIAVSIVAVGLIYCLTSYMGSRYQLTTIDSRTYRIDKHSGETSIIHPNGTITLAKEPEVFADRDLEFDEQQNIEGWAGPNNDRTDFSGRFYNGNKQVIVTEVNVCLTYTNEFRTVKRVYKRKGKVPPLETSYFSVSIVNPGRDLMYSGWHIESSKGYDAK